jgi:hypothetical protein
MFQAFRNFNNEVFEKESALFPKGQGTHCHWRCSHHSMPLLHRESC